jgi:pimeloyl-ACP methyl ester carboxylesterase
VTKQAKEIVVAGRRIELKWHGPAPDRAPTLVLLHEGLGCVAMWGGFPQKLAKRTGYGVFVYSRPGYGKSEPPPMPRPLSYMHDEAFDVLPHVLDQAGVRKCILVGHSDGASIATIYAGGRQDFRVRGLVLMAPHFIVEDISIKSIAEAKEAYDKGDLRERLKRFHGDNVDAAFRGWNDAWLAPEFRGWNIEAEIGSVACPVLAVQGSRDEYGTVGQIRAIARRLPKTRLLEIADCGHSPHRDRPELLSREAGRFILEHDHP